VLSKGAWISQQQVRDHTSPCGGNDNEILSCNIDEAYTNLKLDYEGFDYNNTPLPQTDAYLSWLKAQLSAGNAVAWMILWSGQAYERASEASTREKECCCARGAASAADVREQALLLPPSAPAKQAQRRRSAAAPEGRALLPPLMCKNHSLPPRALPASAAEAQFPLFFALASLARTPTSHTSLRSRAPY
jgi:hypothetical protein